MYRKNQMTVLNGFIINHRGKRSRTLTENNPEFCNFRDVTPDEHLHSYSIAS